MARGVPVVRPQVMETTALGAAMLAGLAVGVYGSLEEIATVWHQDLRFDPEMDKQEQARSLHGWHRAVERALKWIEN